jgi:hypothetical protein
LKTGYAVIFLHRYSFLLICFNITELNCSLHHTFHILLINLITFDNGEEKLFETSG